MKTRGLGRIGCAAAAATLGLVVGHAQATWSILIVDTRTGEIAVASATCLNSIDLKAETPVLIPGVGGATAQSQVDQSGKNRRRLRDLLSLGVDPAEMLPVLEASDNQHQNRQYGIIDASGRAATFSGSAASAWAGGRVGTVGRLAYAVQGNILTGPEVVDAAVQAIEQTPGDLPEKLMAAMEAAFLFGGDGRCSCQLGPTDCGAPPNGGDFEKSADVGYMLVARDGDTPGCNGIVDVLGEPVALRPVDFDLDGRPDLVGATTFNGVNVIAFRNTTAPGDTFITYEVADEVEAGVILLKDIAVGDLTDQGDPGVPDTAVISSSSDALVILPGTIGGLFGAPITVPVGDGPVGMIATDFLPAQGDEVIILNDSSISIVSRDGVGGYAVDETFNAFGARAIAMGRLSGDDSIDLVTVHGGLIVVQEGDGAGGFSIVVFTPGAAGGEDVEVADINADGFDDIIVAAPDAGVLEILTQGPAGVFTSSTITTPNVIGPQRVQAIDLDADGDTDLLAMSGAGEVMPLLYEDGAPAGFTGVFPTENGLRGFLATDANADGMPDIHAGVAGARGLMVAQNMGAPGSPAVFLQDTGCAAGEYHMSLNVAFQPDEAEDPVIQLRQLFTEWRQERVGRPDAVRSTVAAEPRLIAGSHDNRVRIALRDWTGAPVDLDASMLDAVLTEDSAGVTTPTGVERVGPGMYNILIDAGPNPGADTLRITARDDLRDVTLMPGTGLVVVDARTDADGDGVVDFRDVLAFLAAFAEGDPAADFDLSGSVDMNDAIAFLALFVP